MRSNYTNLISYAHLFYRLFAALIDYLFVAMLSLVLSFFINSFLLFFFGIQVDDFEKIFYIILLVVFFVYSVFFEYSEKYRATPGKLIIGITVNGDPYEKITLLQAVIRSMVKLFFLSLLVVPQVMFFVIIIYCLLPVFNPKKQMLHDIIASTVVVKKRRASVILK